MSRMSDDVRCTTVTAPVFAGPREARASRAASVVKRARRRLRRRQPSSVSYPPLGGKRQSSDPVVDPPRQVIADRAGERRRELLAVEHVVHRAELTPLSPFLPRR